MKRNKGIKIIAILAIIFSIVAISIAYSALNSSLIIKGTIPGDNVIWSVGFENLKIIKEEGSAEFVSPPKIINRLLISDFEVKLTKPKDQVSFSFDVVNDGKLDAELTTFVLGKLKCNSKNIEDSNIVCDTLKYSLTYTNSTNENQTGIKIKSGTNVSEGHKLLAGESVNLTLTLLYDGTELPTDNVDIMIGNSILYYEQD